MKLKGPTAGPIKAVASGSAQPTPVGEPCSERRTWYRQTVSWPARCRARHADGALNEHPARIRDISREGARIHLDCPEDVGDILEVEVRQQGLIFRSRAAILSRTPLGRGLEVRVRFESLSVVARDVLSAMTTGAIPLDC